MHQCSRKGAIRHLFTMHLGTLTLFCRLLALSSLVLASSSLIVIYDTLCPQSEGPTLPQLRISNVRQLLLCALASFLFPLSIYLSGSLLANFICTLLSPKQSLIVASYFLVFTPLFPLPFHFSKCSLLPFLGSVLFPQQICHPSLLKECQERKGSFIL